MSHMGEKEIKRKEKTMAVGINLMVSQELYRAPALTWLQCKSQLGMMTSMMQLKACTAVALIWTDLLPPIISAARVVDNGPAYLLTPEVGL